MECVLIFNIFSFFLTKDGVVYSCGWGADGQTGRGHYDNEPHVGPVIGDIEGEKVVKVSCRADCVLAVNGKMICNLINFCCFFIAKHVLLVILCGPFKE